MLSAEDILSGSHLAGGRMIRMIEDRKPEADGLMKSLYPHAGTAFIIGITGSPGVGKSTLINALIAEFRTRDKKVAVIAVDPSSPYTGGAILGDRVRMQQHAADRHVFIRSMASRGREGGLSRATRDAAVVMDAMGFDIIIIETVGAGQAQFDLTAIAHSIGIVTIPGAGDGIQAVKAGILETGDLFIVNKCDLPDADAAANQLDAMLEMRPNSRTGWTPPVIKTAARDGNGISGTADAFLSHFDFMKQTAVWERRQRQLDRSYFDTLIRDLVLEKMTAKISGSHHMADALHDLEAGTTDPISAAQGVVDAIFDLNGERPAAS